VFWKKRPPQPLRLWPAGAVVALAAALLAWIWARADSPVGMSQTTLTLLVALGTAILLLLWWLFFSRAGLLTRVASTLGLVALAGTLNAFLEIRGLSGDLVPQVGWRRTVVPRDPVPPGPEGSASPVIPRDSVPPGPEGSAGTAGDRDAPLASPTPTDRPSSGPSRPEGGEREGAHGPRGLAAPVSTVAPRGDYPQFLGPNRDATLPEIRLARSWPSPGPTAVWRQPIGKGWSGFAVASGLAVTLEERDGEERVVAHALETGQVRWAHRRKGGFSSAMGGDGPRATPAIDGGRVYALGANGTLAALDLASGRVLFEKDVLALNGARRPEHGVAASPLVVDDVVVVLAGGPGGRSLVAYDKVTGEKRWSGGDDPAAYSSPRLATLGGVRQVLVLSLDHLSGHDARTGAVLWRDPWPERAEKVSQPVVLDGDRVFVSVGYGVGGRLLRVARGDSGAWSAEVLWRTRQLKAKFTQVVLHGGFLYGLDEGVLVCLDPKDGERRWKSGRYGHGQVLLAGDLLLVQAEDGEVVLVEPSPERPVELARFAAVEGRAWATPALAGDLLLVRGDAEAACYRLPVEAARAARD
jgi:outer membrane protein assembly factor BamB